ncbi:uncharacterized protein LOC143222757 [Tachypleus tridentatus]|uniref:uncharacterized protein LOC143222757 n=1 Tax=Tachypleus tridentatus TaxID=6853 RepID=UPI003FD321D9
MRNIRMKKLSVNFKDAGAEEDYSVAQPSDEYKIVNGQTFVRPKDRKVNVAHVKSKLDTKAPVSRSKRSSVGLPKVKPNQQRVLHNNNTIKDDVIDEAMQKSIKMNQVEKRLFEDLEEMKKQQQRYGRRNEAVIVQRLANKLRKDVVAAGLREFEGPYNYKTYEKYIFEQIRLLSNQGKIPQIKKNNPVIEGHGRRPAKPFFPKPNVPGKSVLPAISPPSSGGTTASETNTNSQNRSNHIYRSSNKSTIRSVLNRNIGSTVAAPSGVKKRESMKNDELRSKTNVNESNLKQYKQVNNENRPVSHKDTASNVARNDVSLDNSHLKKTEYGFQNFNSLEEEGETGKNFDLQGNIITSNGKTDDTVTTEVTESRYRVTTDLVTDYNGQLKDVSGENNESEQDNSSDRKQEISSSSGKGETNNKDKKSVNESVHRVMSASLQNGAQPSDTVTVEVSSEGSATKYTHTTTVEDLLRATTVPRTDDESQKRSLKLEDMLDLENDGPLTFEIRHGREKNVFKLPADKLQNNKKWQVTFTIGKEEHRPVC